LRAGRYIVAATLLLAAPLVAFLATNQYPVATPETGLLFAGCLAAGALLGFLSSRFAWLGVLILGGGTALCLNSLYGWPGSTAGLLLLLAACLAVAAALRRHLPAVLIAAGLVFIASTLLIPSSGAGEDRRPAAGATAARPQPAAAADLPVILHLVLDEHIGIDGLPPEVPGSAELARWLTESYVGQGFRVHPDAYSEYFETRNSLANLLNFTSEESDWAHLVEQQRKPYVLAESAYFRHLARLGYRLHVYQSDYLDYCRVPGVTYAGCAHYRANTIAALPAASLSIGERARFIRNSVLGTSHYLQRLHDKYMRIRAALPRLALPAWDDGVSRVGPLSVLPVLRELEADLRAAKPGDAYFAHLLIPHFPYMLDAQCRVRSSIDEWLYNIDPTASSELEPNNPAGRAARYERYFAQIRCEQRLVNRLFEAMREAGVWRTAIVVVHGDHGSRIVRRLPVQQTAASLTRSDLHDAFSTLFAAKLPGRAPGVVRDAKPLQALLADALGLAPVAGPAKVMLQDHEEHGWRPFPLSALRAQRAGD
jgi:hypothetical protein